MKFQLVSIIACLAAIQPQLIDTPAQLVDSAAVTTTNSSQSSLINCSWPCPNPADGCILTNEGASCAPRGPNRWMIKAPQVAPIYTGQPSYRPGQSCQPAPIPNLPAAAEGSATSAGQSVIMWPMTLECRPLDKYLGNCRGGLYCSSAGDDEANPVCRIRFQAGVACILSNQCYSGLCTNSVCQPGRDDFDDNNNDNRRRN